MIFCLFSKTTGLFSVFKSQLLRSSSCEETKTEQVKRQNISLTWKSLKEHIELKLRLGFEIDPADDELFSVSANSSRILISRSQISLSHSTDWTFNRFSHFLIPPFKDYPPALTFTVKLWKEYPGEGCVVVWYVELVHLRTWPPLETCYS